eukprot:m.476098 g.476098  ORF g.476098 m.476098 type:complete len:117 (-) comp40063_c0_seq1:880-1230(-)
MLSVRDTTVSAWRDTFGWSDEHQLVLANGYGAVELRQIWSVASILCGRSLELDTLTTSAFASTHTSTVTFSTVGSWIRTDILRSQYSIRKGCVFLGAGGGGPGVSAFFQSNSGWLM